MDEPQISTSATIYLLLIVCMLFVAVDGIDLYQLVNQWEYGKTNFTKPTFESCLKYPILARTGFSVFSFLAAFSSFLISLFLSISIDYFVDKIARTYVYMNYIIFGPYMLAVGVLGAFHWDKILFNCDYNQAINNENDIIKIFSYSNLFNLSACLGLSFLITLGMVIYQTIIAYFNSIVERGEGNLVLRKCFWWTVLKMQNL